MLSEGQQINIVSFDQARVLLNLNLLDDVSCRAIQPDAHEPMVSFRLLGLQLPPGVLAGVL